MLEDANSKYLEYKEVSRNHDVEEVQINQRSSQTPKQANKNLQKLRLLQAEKEMVPICFNPK